MFSYFIHSTMFRGLRREHYLPLSPSHNKRPPRSKANKSFPEHNKISSSPPIYVQERRYCCLYGINLCSSSTCAPRRPKPPPAQQIKFALGEFPLLLALLAFPKHAAAPRATNITTQFLLCMNRMWRTGVGARVSPPLPRPPRLPQFIPLMTRGGKEGGSTQIERSPKPKP